MKKPIHSAVALLEACAVVVAAPLSGHASEAGNVPQRLKKSSIFDPKPSPGFRDKVVYVLSDTPPTGSNVPVVYRVYHGTVNVVGSQSRAVYTNLGAAGSEDVTSTLARVDPAIGVNGGHR